MGWKARKSKKLGPFQVTASLAGLSFSAGIPGARVKSRADGKNQASVGIPGTGISYSEILPNSKSSGLGAVPIGEWSADLLALDAMTGLQFEEWSAEYFRRLGFDVAKTPITHDYGADLVIRRGDELLVVQTKRWQGDVGVSAVQEIVAAMDYYGASGAIVLTNSTLTVNARNLASKQKRPVAVWDRTELMRRLPRDTEYRAPAAESTRAAARSSEPARNTEGKKAASAAQDSSNKFRELCNAINQNNDSKSHLERGIWFYQEKQYEMVLQDFDSALSCDSKNASAQVYKGMSLTKMGKPVEAVAALTGALVNDSGLALAWYYRGLSYKELKDSVRARQDLLRSAELYGQKGKVQEQKRSLDAIVGL